MKTKGGLTKYYKLDILMQNTQDCIKAYYCFVYVLCAGVTAEQEISKKERLNKTNTFFFLKFTALFLNFWPRLNVIIINTIRSE